MVLAAGCRNDMPFTPVDLAGGGTDDGGIPDMTGGGGDLAPKSYTMSSIAAMRQAAKSGNFELDNVVAIAIHTSKSSPKLYVQDAAGGGYSAIVSDCSASSMTHPCSQGTAVNAIAIGHSVTLQGTYVKAGATKGNYETFYIDTVMDNGAAAAMPPVATLMLTDIERNGTNAANWFQKVSVNIATADALKMYDWTPAEFVYAMGAATCKPPYQFGFGMLPQSVPAPTSPAGAACSGTTAQPTGVATPDAHEVLFGTDFYTAGWTYSSDCRCAATNNDTLVTSSMSLSGTLKGILVYTTVYMTGTGYQYLAPQAKSDAMIQ